MAYGNWDEIIAVYQGMYAESPRTSEHASAMLELIPKIRDEPALQGIVPGTSHATLFLQVPQKGKAVYVWYENGGYDVDLYDFSLNSGSQCYKRQRVVGDSSEVVLTLRKHIEKIRGEGNPSNF
jgi:hypothetical protein